MNAPLLARCLSARVVPRLAAPARALAWLIVLAATLLVAAPAFAESPRLEAGAQEALTKAEDLYLSMAFAQGLALLRKAERACGEQGCSVATRASLFRDIGTFQLRLEDEKGANASFLRALRLSPELALNPSYDARDLRLRWQAAKDSVLVATQPGEGDFEHTAPREQKESTPLPIYVEYRGSEQLTSVVVKYKSASMRSYKRATLARVGDGWGGNIPCADVSEGVLRYYVQGLDPTGLPTVNSGSPKAPYSVPIRSSITGEPPSLPGMAPPATCGDEELEAIQLEAGERCQEDSQCKSGVCSQSRCALATDAPPSSDEYARIWIGVSGSVDVAFLPSGQDVCKQTPLTGTPASGGYWCTNPDGSDFPSASQNDALIAGRSGSTSGGAASGVVRILGSFDYALKSTLLLGVRAGYAAQAYPGHAAVDAGRTPSAALHAEVRGTYLFGGDGLTGTGLVPYTSLGFGYGRFDASTRVMVGQQNIAGDKAVEAWLVGGPWFGALGVGVRYALSPRIAFSIGAKATLAFGSGSTLGLISPEIALQYGF